MLKPERVTSSGVWHPGEVEMQRSVGAEERMAVVGPRALRSYMPQQHRDFFAQLPMLVLGTLDSTGRPWTSLRFGYPGFIRTPDDTHLEVAATTEPSDPAQFNVGDPVGVLGIELQTRRRNRANGRVLARSEEGFTVAVEQSFGNCPRYISRREPSFVREPGEPATEVVQHRGLDDEARAMIRNADTFFVASFAPRENGPAAVDVSHRGGPSGFVEVGSEGELSVPDYAGNNFFNTLGNFICNPVAGLLFVDFERGHVTQLSGSVEVDLDPSAAASLEGAERVWRFRTDSLVRRRAAAPLRFTTLDTSSR